MGRGGGSVRFAVTVLVVLLAWRAFFCLAFVPWWEARAGVAPAPDAYPLLARSLLERGELGYPGQGAIPTTIRTPVFPAWLALGMILGVDRPPGLAFWASLVPIACGTWLAVAARRRWGTAAGWIAAGVAVFHPLPTLVTGRVMSDEFAGSLGMMGLLAWAAAGEWRGAGNRFRWLAPVGVGVLWGAHVLARPSGLLTLAGWVLAVAARERTRWREGIAVLLLAVAPAAAWSVRSSLLEGRPVVISSLTFYNFWLGEAQDRLGAERKRGEHAAEKFRLILREGGLDLGAPEAFWYGRLQPREVAELERSLRQAAVRRMVRDPGGYLARFGRGLVRFWFAAETRRRQAQYVVLVLPVLLLAAAGAVRGVRKGLFRDDPVGLAALWAVLLHWLAFAAIVPYARYSVAIYPELGRLAAGGAGGWWAAHGIRAARGSSSSPAKPANEPAGRDA